MTDINDILNLPPYSLAKNEKDDLLNPILTALTRYHYEHGSLYRKMLESDGFDPYQEYTNTQIPFLPVRLFKMFDLLSVEKDSIIKTMTSSGTSGKAVSRIFLDRETSANQTKALTKIISSFIGKQRLPMLIIDSESIVTNRNFFSARTAGVLGFSMFGSKKVFALDEDMALSADRVLKFLEEHRNEKIFLFGFTFMIWQHLYKEIEQRGINIDLSNAVLIHGGGWKKIIDESVSPAEFKKRLCEHTGLDNIHDYYGMVEQTGSIYMECEKGFLHTSIFSDIFIRRSFDFSVAEKGEKGLIQLLSILPKSYPGHSILSEDEGIIHGEDDCACGRPGKYFTITGRIKNAELRGCSDVYAERF